MPEGDGVDQTSGDVVTGVDVVDGVLTFRRADGTTETYSPEAVAPTTVFGYANINQTAGTVWTPRTAVVVDCPSLDCDPQYLPEGAVTGFYMGSAGAAWGVYCGLGGTAEDWGDRSIGVELHVSNSAGTQRRKVESYTLCSDLVGGGATYLSLDNLADQQAGSDLTLVTDRIVSAAGGSFFAALWMYVYNN